MLHVSTFFEIIFLVTGIYILSTGKLPSGFTGGPQYKVDTRIARLIGVLYVAPLPISFCLAVVVFLTGVPLNKVGFIEPLAVLLIIISSVVIIQISKTRVEELDESIKEQ